MTKILTSVAAAALLVTSATFAAAQSSNSNADAARAMADRLSGPNDLGLGTPSVGAAASAVSGNEPTLGTAGRSESGWGNTGSDLLSSEGRVSRGSERGNKGGGGEGSDR